MKSYYAPFALLIGLILLAAGLAVMIQPGRTNSVAGLQAFNSYSDLNSYLDRNSVAKGLVSNPTYDQALGAAGSTGDLSTTNVQVTGVQEEDRVLTDGTYIYSAGQSDVVIIRATPASAMVNVSSLNMSKILDAAPTSSVYVEGIYLVGDSLVVLCQLATYSQIRSVYAVDQVAPSYMIGTTSTMLSLFDVSVPSVPHLIKTTGVSGSFSTSRVHGDDLFVFAIQYAWDPSTGGSVVPATMSNDSSDKFEPGQILYDPGNAGVSDYLNLVRFNLADLRSEQMSLLTGYSSILYVSENDIYVTYPHYSSYGPMIAVDGGTTVSSDTRSVSYTTIYKIDISGTGMELRASGSVRGDVIDRYAIDEKNGYLRIATTDYNTTTETLVSVLSSNLSLVGQIGGIGLGETMQSSRYIDDMLYLVTYHQVDPLFAIDLSDPHAPRVLGELTMPGFSTYLHPVDATHMIGLGFEGHSMKVSLYNVSDRTNPVEEQKLLLSNFTYSPALYDPHAVTFDPSRSLLIVPVTGYGNGWQYNCSAFLFNTSGGISLIGTAGSNNSGGVERTMYIGDTLYVCSQYSISAYGMNDLVYRGSIILGAYPQYWYGYEGSGGEPIPMSLVIK